MNRGVFSLKRIVTFLFILSVFLLQATIKPEAKTSNYNFKYQNLPEKNDYYFDSQDLVIIGNDSDLSAIKRFDSDFNILKEKVVLVYDYNTNVKNLINEQEESNVFGILYYYDIHGVLNIIKLERNGYFSKQEMKKLLDEHLGLETKNVLQQKRLHQLKAYNLEMNKDINNTYEAPIEIQSNNNDDDLPILRVRKKTFDSYYGYFILGYDLYRYNTDYFNIYRVQVGIQFTSGFSANDSDYEDSHKSKRANVRFELNQNIQYGYGVWPSEQPLLLDYWPKNELMYKTITSGIQYGLTIGKGGGASAGATESGFEVSASSTFNSEFGWSYNYSETVTVSTPFIDGKQLSKEEGASWSLRNFNLDYDPTVTIYPGILLEVGRNRFGGRYDGECNISIEYVLDRFYWVPLLGWKEIPTVKEKVIKTEEKIFLDNRL